MKTVEINNFAGVRNDITPERFAPEDLQKGTNIELDETGKPLRRLGTTALNSTPSHSLWANDELAFIVYGGTLHRINPDFTFTDLGVEINGNRVAYTRVGNDVYFTDNLITGVVGLSGVRPWGITPPAPIVAAAPVGALREGTYLVTTTYVRNGGLESGASPVMAVTCDGSQSLSITMPPSDDPLVTEWRVYVSDTNGELPYLVSTMLSMESVAVISELPAARNLPVRSLRCGPPPAGQVIGTYKGRAYIADGSYLWYTQPYEYELVHRAVNFLPFPSPVRTFASVADGIYIGTDDDISFLSGDEPQDFKRVTVAPYGSVLGTEQTIPAYYFGKGENPTPVNVWMSKQGMCAGLDGGNFMNLTGDRFVLPDGVAKGASLLKLRGASPQLVTTLFS